MDMKKTNKILIDGIIKLQNDEVENFVNEEFRLPQYYKDNMKKIRAKLAKGEIKGDWYRRLFDSLTDEQKKQIASGSLAGRRILVKFGFSDDYYGGKAMQDILITKIAKDISESKKTVVRGKTGSYSIPSPKNVFVGEYGKREGLDRGKILGYMDDNKIKLNKTNLRKLYKNDDLARELDIPYGYFQGAINQLIDDLMGLKDYKRELAKVEKQINTEVSKTYKQGRISRGRRAGQMQKSEYLHNKASVLRDKIKDIEQAQKSKKIKIRTPDKPKDKSNEEIPMWKKREDAKARALAKREARRKAAMSGAKSSEIALEKEGKFETPYARLTWNDQNWTLEELVSKEKKGLRKAKHVVPNVFLKGMKALNIWLPANLLSLMKLSSKDTYDRIKVVFTKAYNKSFATMKDEYPDINWIPKMSWEETKSRVRGEPYKLQGNDFYLTSTPDSFKAESDFSKLVNKTPGGAEKLYKLVSKSYKYIEKMGFMEFFDFLRKNKIAFKSF